ncbi:unnamed protein product, partial [Ectocarpus fasciculatus]
PVSAVSGYTAAVPVASSNYLFLGMTLSESSIAQDVLERNELLPVRRGSRCGLRLANHSFQLRLEMRFVPQTPPPPWRQIYGRTLLYHQVADTEGSLSQLGGIVPDLDRDKHALTNILP